MQVNALVRTTDKFVVVQLLDAEIKRNLWGILCSLGNQYIVGTVLCLDGACNLPVSFVCNSTISFSDNGVGQKVLEFYNSFLRTSI